MYSLDKRVISNYSNKLKFFIFLVIIAFLSVVYRVYNLQIIDGELYAQKAENNFLDIVKVRAKRGYIYDRYGKVIAKNLAAFNLYIVPKFTNKDTIDFLKRKLQLPLEKKFNLDNILQSKSKDEILIKERLTPKELSLIEARMFRLKGVDIVTEPYRFYPEHGVVSHIVGYINKINKKEYETRKDKGYSHNDYIGRMGIERSMENYLKGKNGKKIVLRDKNGSIKKDQSLKELIELKNREFDSVKEGDDVYLTLDLDLQREIDEIFFNVKSGAAVVIDVDSGDILSIYSKPTFDPNQILKGNTEYIQDIFKDQLQPTLNKVFKSYYPGSVFKIVTAIAALDMGVVDENDTCDCKGYEMFGTTKFRCWKRTGHGRVNLEKALATSCDVYFYKLAKKIGINNINKYAQKLGIGVNFTDVIKGISEGNVPSIDWYKKKGKKYYRGFDLNTAIGQGDVKLSPFKVAELYSITANLGIRKKINIVSKVVSKSKKVKYKRKIKQIDTKISPYIFQKVNKGLFSAVNKPGGTAYYLKSNSIMVSGKTGTAQVASKTKDEYDTLIIPWRFRHHAWFAAFAPSYKPEIVVVVMVEHGKTSSRSASLAMNIIKSYEKLKMKRIQANFLKNLKYYKVSKY